MQRYPAYKDSGFDWLKEVPEHWEQKSIRAITKIKTERNKPDLPLLSVYRDYGVIYKDSRDDNHNRAGMDLSNYKVVAPNDLVINKMKTWQGSLGVSQYEGIVSPAYIVCDLDNSINGRYLNYLLRCRFYVHAYNRISYGIRVDQWDMHYQDFKQLPVFLPSQEEQKAIVAFLEEQTAVIHQFLTNKRRLIALLEEQKQVVINTAVTQGLETAVPHKPSGIDRSGEIPFNWEVRRIRTLIERIEQGVSPQAETFLADENSWGVLKSGCVNGGFFRDTEHKRLPENYPIDEGIVVKTGDVLVSRASGSTKFVGSVGLVESLRYNLILSDKTFRLRLRNPEIKEFLVYAMNAPYFRTQVELVISGAEGLANNLPQSALKDLRVVVPKDVNEAQKVAGFIKSRFAEINAAIERTQREIELIEEYRTTLIAHAVTGKIDVRSVV